ncbi:MAG: hypothetical protein IT324_11980 [Anaerolineae bacterium]|nr:hypothetical protein [Anaerolineae bacterium]
MTLTRGRDARLERLSPGQTADAAAEENRLIKGIVNERTITLLVYTLVGGLYVWLTHR